MISEKEFKQDFINKQDFNFNIEKYCIRQYNDIEKIVRIDTNWAKIFPVTAFSKLPLFTKHRNFMHYRSTILGYYRDRYTGGTFIRLDHGHRSVSTIVSWFLMPPQLKETALKLRYFYFNKYVYLFRNTLNLNKICVWNMGLDYNYHFFKLHCTRYHNIL